MKKMKKIKNVFIEVTAWFVTLLIITAILKYIIYG
jgi:hypothetical protein